MFEYFFAKRANDRTRDEQLRQLNSALDAGMVERRQTRADCAFADSATTLPQAFLVRQSTAAE